MLILLLQPHLLQLICPIMTQGITMASHLHHHHHHRHFLPHLSRLLRIKSKLYKVCMVLYYLTPAYFSGLISYHLSPCTQHTKQIKLSSSEIPCFLSASYLCTCYSFCIEHSYYSRPCLPSLVPKSWVECCSFVFP